jgi:hypothetical protein
MDQGRATLFTAVYHTAVHGAVAIPEYQIGEEI